MAAPRLCLVPGSDPAIPWRQIFDVEVELNQSDNPAVTRAKLAPLLEFTVFSQSALSQRISGLSALAGGGLGGAVLVVTLTYGNAVYAQQIDNTQTLPDAKPGECYAKVVTPARFVTRSEEIVIQEASERIEAVPTIFETLDERVVVKESSSIIEATAATFESLTEQVMTRPAEQNWTVGSGEQRRPANPLVLQGLADSGVDVDEVEVGSCFVEHWTPATYQTELQRVLVKEASERIETIAAVYETVEERILVREESSRIVDVPAVYRTEQETILVEPARSVWRPGRGLIERVDHATGEIMCLVEVPARYETVSRSVLDTPATTRREVVPAEYETIQVQRLVSPASERRIEVPAQYETIETQRRVGDPEFFWVAQGAEVVAAAQPTGREACLVETPAEFTSVAKQVLASNASTVVSPVPAEYQSVSVQRVISDARENRITVPAVTETLSRQVEVEPSRLEWQPVLCETNMTPDIVTEIQEALQREGYNPGPVDGVIGGTTLEAIEAYQIDKNLSRGGVTYQTLQSLRVEEASS